MTSCYINAPTCELWLGGRGGGLEELQKIPSNCTLFQCLTVSFSGGLSKVLLVTV